MISNNLYRNLGRVGKVWSKEEILKMLESIKQNKTIKEIAEEHERTTNGITCQLKKIAAEYYFNNKLPIQKIQKFTGLSEAVIQDAIDKYSFQHNIPYKRAPSELTEVLQIVKDIQQKVASTPKIYQPTDPVLGIEANMNNLRIDTFTPTQTIQKSRELLQSLSKSPYDMMKYPIIKGILEDIWTDVYRTTILKGRTTHTLRNFQLQDYNANNRLHQAAFLSPFTRLPEWSMENPEFRREVIEAIKIDYEGCTVEYSEPIGPDGKILERILVIDWSEKKEETPIIPVVNHMIPQGCFTISNQHVEKLSKERVLEVFVDYIIQHRAHYRIFDIPVGTKYFAYYEYIQEELEELFPELCWSVLYKNDTQYMCRGEYKTTKGSNEWYKQQSPIRISR